MINDIDKVNEQCDMKAENSTSMHEEPEIHSEEKEHSPHYEDASISASAKSINFIERIFELIFKHGFFKTVCAILIIMAGVMLWQFVNAVNYNKVAERVVQELVEKQEKEALAVKEGHAEGSALRLANNPKIVKVLTRMVYELNADRVSILEMHNGKENPTNLPFIYCDMTYEETKGHVQYIADEWEQMNMSKYSFFTYMMNERAFCGLTDSLWNIDKKFASKVHANDARYIGMVVIKNEVEIGFLVASFLEKPEIDEHRLIIQLTDCAQELGFLLDLTHDSNKI